MDLTQVKAEFLHFSSDLDLAYTLLRPGVLLV